MVGAGLGVSAVPALCIEQMHELGARCVPLHDPVIERQVGILTKTEHELSMAAQALHDTLVASSVPPLG
ncbi:LysR substrate-binding domain-containing protein [Oceanimonas doudoroffii]|uniref:LysR substrate-binding domain-containing protein n=1 Tax=Oceanimonas doudoroffii TaxID=84158 RepID=UPI001B80912A|nr:LysR substrate-binding domain-containing protein [Oceanimonas doudoroffii]